MRCEGILLEADDRGAFSVTTIRPTYTYGDRAIPITAMSGAAYLDRVANGRPIIVPGDGSCLWASCHSDDAAVAYAGAVGNPRAFRRTYNVAGQEWMTWDEYHRRVGDAMGVDELNLVHVPTDLLERAVAVQAHPPSYIFRGNSLFDSARAMRDLGFRCTIPWEEGVGRMIEWQRAHGGFPTSDETTIEDRLADAWARLGDAMVGELVG
jgi:nucleoside-diphosphate-sugar epimerase